MTTPAPHSLLVALGSNVGDRLLNLRTAIRALSGVARIVRLSAVWESDAVDAPRESGAFLNMVAAGWTILPPHELLDGLHRIEASMGRIRRVRNQPRIVDLDLILYGARVVRDGPLLLPHPRYRERGFVLDPLRELRLPWVDPTTSVPLARLRAGGGGVRLRTVYEATAQAAGRY